MLDTNQETGSMDDSLNEEEMENDEITQPLSQSLSQPTTPSASEQTTPQRTTTTTTTAKRSLPSSSDETPQAKRTPAVGPHFNPLDDSILEKRVGMCSYKTYTNTSVKLL